MADLKFAGAVFRQKNSLFQCFRQLIPLTSQMGGVKTVEFFQDGHQMKQFRRIRKSAGGVKESRGKTCRPLMQSLPEQFRHTVQLCGGECSAAISADVGAQGVVPAERGDVDRRFAPVQFRCVIVQSAPGDRHMISGIEVVHMFPDFICQDRKRREPAVACDFRRDSLRDFAGCFRRGKN